MKVSEMREKTFSPSGVRAMDAAKRRNRLSVGVRVSSCAALLALLAVSGYVGASSPKAQTVSAPIVQRTVIQGDTSAMTFEETKAEYAAQREAELSLLDSVINNPKTSQETLQNALQQKTQIAERMELEAQIRAAFSHMGYEDTAVICGAQTITLVAPEKYGADESESMRLVDAAASVSGMSAADVKIILSKK